MARNGVYLSACMVYRNSASYLREWIEFHRLVGFERFYLYDNGSSDDHRDVLAPYLDQEIVVLHDWPGVRRQHAAIDHCLATYRDESRWIAFIDDDEFVFSQIGRPVPAVLREFEPYSGLGVNLFLFGTGGHVTRPPGLVIESYLYRQANALQFIKSIVDPRRTERCYGAHHFVFREGYAVDGDGEPIEGAMTRRRMPRPLRINHYYTKSEQELREKWAAVRADTGELRPPPDLSKLENLNRRRDERILIYLPALREALA
jgi:hypothetical protein